MACIGQFGNTESDSTEVTMPGVVEINGNYYKVTALKQTYVPRQSAPTRLKGVQSRADDPSIGRYRYAGFPLGVGWSRQNRETGRGVGGVTDTTCDLLHRVITIGRLQETQYLDTCLQKR